jgi:hypothetical protein
MRARWRHMLIGATALLACLLIGGFAFVFYFMHMVYEAEEVLDPGDVPAAVRQDFEKRFPDAADTAWKFADNLYEAAFYWGGQDEVEAYFEPAGAWVKTEFPAAVAELPEKARTYLEAQKGAKVSAVERVQMPGSPVAYEAELANPVMEWDCLFDAEGNLLAATRDGSVFE